MIQLPLAKVSNACIRPKDWGASRVARVTHGATVPHFPPILQPSVALRRLNPVSQLELFVHRYRSPNSS
jgi:hypothetical protein